MDERARATFLGLLRVALTGGDSPPAGWFRAHRRPLAAVAMTLLLARGFVVVPAIPAVSARAVSRVPGLLGSRALIWLLARRGFAVIPDPGPATAEPVRLTRDGQGSGLFRRVRATEREFGLAWPDRAETMVGLRRLENLQSCLATVLADGVPGDLIEAGVWRGGSAIFMRALLAAYGVEDVQVWVADSFAGLPAPRPGIYPADEGVDYTGHPELAVSLERVQANFDRYGMLDERVRFLPGWFSDTLPGADIDRLALIRLDGDLYESTIDALENLYPKLSPGGFCIVDDYGALPACRQAVEDYRAAHDISDALMPIDWTGAYWRRAQG